MDELDVQAVEFRDELWQRVQLCLTAAPVVVLLPVFTDFLHVREQDALTLIVGRFTVGPPHTGEPPAEIIESLPGYVESKVSYLTHGVLPVEFRRPIDKR